MVTTCASRRASRFPLGDGAHYNGGVSRWTCRCLVGLIVPTLLGCSGSGASGLGRTIDAAVSLDVQGGAEVRFAAGPGSPSDRALDLAQAGAEVASDRAAPSGESSVPDSGPTRDSNPADLSHLPDAAASDASPTDTGPPPSIRLCGTMKAGDGVGGVFSQDGKRAYVATSLAVFEIDPANGAELRTFGPFPKPVMALTTARPDSVELLYVQTGDELLSISLAGGATTRRLSIEARKPVSFSADGKRVAVPGETLVHVQSLPDGAIVRDVAAFASLQPYFGRLSPDGSLVAVLGASAGGVQVGNIDFTRISDGRRLDWLPRNGTLHFSIGPNNRLVLSRETLYSRSDDGSTSHLVQTFAGGVGMIFSPDGTRLASALGVHSLSGEVVTSIWMYAPERNRNLPVSFDAANTRLIVLVTTDAGARLGFRFIDANTGKALCPE